MRAFPPLPSSPHSRKGLHGHRQRPGVNLPLCCHGNGRAEKKGGSQGVGSYDPTEGEERGEESVCSCILSLSAAVFLPATHTHTHFAITHFCFTQCNQPMPPSAQRLRHKSMLPTNNSWLTGWKQSKSQQRETSDKWVEIHLPVEDPTAGQSASCQKLLYDDKETFQTKYQSEHRKGG